MVKVNLRRERGPQRSLNNAPTSIPVEQPDAAAYWYARTRQPINAIFDGTWTFEDPPDLAHQVTIR
jgi:hypothetical protein